MRLGRDRPAAETILTMPLPRVMAPTRRTTSRADGARRPSERALGLIGPLPFYSFSRMPIPTSAVSVSTITKSVPLT